MSDKSKQKRISATAATEAAPQGRGHRRAPAPAGTRSNRHIVAQVIDDAAGNTVAAASSTLEADLRVKPARAGRQRRRSEHPWPNAPVRRGSKPSCSTVGATATTVGWRPWPTPHVTQDWSSDGSERK